jgi:hypothetical protein
MACARSSVLLATWVGAPILPLSSTSRYAQTLDEQGDPSHARSPKTNGANNGAS